jgi:hypothetical protein
MAGRLVTDTLDYDSGRAEEPFFLENATRWAEALRDAGADVVIAERPGSHGGPFWRDELPRMVD